MKKLLLVNAILSLFLFEGFSQEGILFLFKHNKGDAVSHVSTVEEEAYLNGRLNNHTQFINRTSTTVKEVEKDGSALIHTHYMTTRNTLVNHSEETLSWGEEDNVRIHRKASGELYDSDNDFLPTVRNIPSFPDYEVTIGESWEKEGLEVHDLRELFSMDQAIQIPFTATYTYTGDTELNGNTLQIIEVYYEFFQDNSNGDYYRNTTYAGASGYAKQKIFWDNKKHDLDHYDEEFQIKMVDFYGNVFLFQGISHGQVTEYKSVNNEENRKKLEKSVKKYRLDNISVKQSDKGLTISLENIQFEADSDRLLPSEQKKLEKIGEILKDFTNDLLITGHTALRGTASGRQQLSEERAKAVADFLISKGIRDQYHVFTQGKGASDPVASNETEAGRSRNRRVEITIMD
ncbi:MAG: OmpA family protein [Treponema sp.]|nr:OmpA family protein [Treponema sp.]